MRGGGDVDVDRDVMEMGLEVEMVLGMSFLVSPF